MLLDITWIILGSLILVAGGEILVRGSAGLARSLGITPMIVGLTVVALGTSAPELIVCVLASLDGKPDICAGNIVGSNILNVLLVLGVTATICPLQASASFVRREIPIAVMAAAIFWWMCRNGMLTRFEAALLLVFLCVYMVLTVWIAKRAQTKVIEEFAESQGNLMKGRFFLQLSMILAGLVALGFGADLFLKGAVNIARVLQLSESIIGLTLVALGTSFPELAACVIAALRKHADICLGNVIGSCIYNILAIGGASGVILPLPVSPELTTVHLPVMVGATVLLLVFVGTGLKLSRREGIALLVVYAGYMGWSIWDHLRDSAAAVAVT